jgi:hypothetical protein
MLLLPWPSLKGNSVLKVTKLFGIFLRPIIWLFLTNIEYLNTNYFLSLNSKPITINQKNADYGKGVFLVSADISLKLIFILIIEF